MMNPQRFATAATALVLVIAGCAVVWLAGFGSAGTDDTDAANTDAANIGAANINAANINAANINRAPALVRRAPSLAADAEPADTAQPTAIGKPAGETTVAVAAGTVTMSDLAPALANPEPAAGIPPAQEQPADAAPTDASHTAAPETPPVQVATTSSSDLLPDGANKSVSSIEIPRPCPEEADDCINRYLWALYERTPKEDTIKVTEQRKVVIKKKGKKVTVTRNFSKPVAEDFAWKDPKAAERAAMPMMDYVIGGMDQGFKLKLFHILRAADEAGLDPGITSAFRDDYRQSLASGLKAAINRSYHGGSFRGGYGHGLAADVVSVKGETRDERYHSSQILWKWIDEHGQEFGIGRPYLDRDPPHLAPIDGTEYASHHHAPEVQHAVSNKRSKLAVRDNHNAGKHAKTARSAKQRTI